MFCFQCGTKMRDGAKFCPNCGAPQRSGSSSAEPAPAPAGGPAFTLDYTVTEEQIRREERIFIEDPRLPRTSSIRLASWMLKDPLVTISPNAEKGEPFPEFNVRLNIIPASTPAVPFESRPRLMGTLVGNVSTTESRSTFASTTEPRSTYASTTEPRSTYTSTTEPRSTYASTTEPGPGVSVPASGLSAKAFFRIDLPEKLNSFRMGGDDEGNVDVYPDRIELFKKSKGVALAFGAIGSAIEGKGKLFYTLRPSDIVRHEKQLDAKGHLFYYIFSLRDGRALRLHIKDKGGVEAAIDSLFG